MPAESIDLECALGRILATDVIAPYDLPPFPNSAMDGYALRGADLPARGERGFRIAGRVLAGSAHAPRFDAGECLRITTGAPLPPDADTVVIKESVRIENDTVVVGAGQRFGTNVRPAGEDYRAGERVLRAGDCLTAAHLGVLAACGHATTQVARLPRVALFVTGDELVPPDRALGFGQIHDSNRYSLGGLLRGLGIEPEPVAHVRDDSEALRVALREAGERCDVVISSGGVSAGEADFLPSVMAELGQVHFWKVRMKPGMPLLFATLDRACLLALPGNPVSVLATYCTLARPLLDALQGCGEAPPPWHAQLASAWIKRHERLEFLRGSLQSDANGVLRVHPNAADGSHRMAAAAHSDALIVLPEGLRDYAQGDAVRVLPLRF